MAQDNADECSNNYVPRKVRRLVTDPFFDEGNWACLQGKQTVVKLDEEELLHQCHKAFDCQIVGCHQVFTNLHTFEDHYGSNHRYVCAECRRSFPSNHLLDLHVLEQHDSLFQIMTAKNNMYRCLVDTCSETFSSSTDRKTHVITFHKYPSNFRFGDFRGSISTYTAPKERLSLIKKGEEVPDSVPRSSCSMEVETSTPTDKPMAKIKYNCKVPGNICFGLGAPRCFVTKKSKRQKQSKPIDMSSLSSALHETMDEC